jgi:hypothetical protein
LKARIVSLAMNASAPAAARRSLAGAVAEQRERAPTHQADRGGVEGDWRLEGGEAGLERDEDGAAVDHEGERAQREERAAALDKSGDVRDVCGEEGGDPDEEGAIAELEEQISDRAEDQTAGDPAGVAVAGVAGDQGREHEHRRWLGDQAERVEVEGAGDDEGDGRRDPDGREAAAERR